MTFDIKQLETKLWAAADELRANSNLTSAQYSEPVLGLIFLKFVDGKFKQAKADLEQKSANQGGRARSITKEHYQAQGLLYIPEDARYEYLINLPEGGDIGQKINNAMKLIETENESLAGVLPKDYTKLDNKIILTLLKKFNEIPDSLAGDAFGQIYECYIQESNATPVF